jgi:flagellar biosynthesis protein FliR
VVGFITATASSGSASLSKEYPWIQNNTLYVFLNKFFALGLLLLLLSTLPVIFDFIARSYEGRKLESEIQNSIMTRYFYYQLANVFVSVGLGSIANSIQDIIQNPSAILSILGKSLPSLSLYFTNLLIIKSFIAVPIELLRLWPLVRILTVRLFADKKTRTTREQQNGKSEHLILDFFYQNHYFSSNLPSLY